MMVFSLLRKLLLSVFLFQSLIFSYATKASSGVQPPYYCLGNATFHGCEQPDSVVAKTESEILQNYQPPLPSGIYLEEWQLHGINLIPCGEEHDCESSSTYTSRARYIQTGKPWHLIMITIFKLKCNLPFQWSSSDKACITYCPEGLNFDYDLGRCDIQKDETPQCDALQHNPIDTSTGEKKQLFTDFTQNTALPLSFKRNYGSLRAPEVKSEYTEQIDSPNKVKIIQPSWYRTPNTGLYQAAEAQKQGHMQWRHNYQVSLAKYSGENVVITLSDMTQRQFIYDATSSSYSSRYPNGDALKTNGQGWQYIDNNQLSYYFNSQGQLTSISNELNEALLFSYNANGLLTQVVNDQNQTLIYSYNSDDLLMQVTQPDGNNITFTYDARNNLTSVTYPDNTPADLTDNPKEIYHYESGQHPYALTGITDEKGVRYASWAYNNIGQATLSTHVLGAEDGSVTYDNANRKVSSFNSFNKESQIEFDSKGRVARVIGASCSTSGEDGIMSYQYNSDGQAYLLVDELGNSTHKTYQTSGLAKGLPTSIKEAWNTTEEQETAFVYDDASLTKPTQIIHPNGLIENFVYGVNGRIESRSLTDGIEVRTTSYQYNAEGLLASIDGSRTDVSDVTSFTYTNGRIATITNALGHITTFENYDGFGNATKVTDANGVVTQLTYDARGWLTSIDIAGRITQFEYDALGQLIKTTQPSGHFLQYSYDDARRLTDITNNLGEGIHFSHDSEGNVTSQTITDSLGNMQFSQQYVYDQISRLSQTISATNQTWTNEYDVAGNLVKEITPANTEKQTAFDQLNRIAQQLDQANEATGFEYNKLDQLTKVTDALSRETTYQYNMFGEVILQTSNDTGVTSFLYDHAGNLVSKTDARGVTVTYQYDALNRLIAENYSDATINNTAYIYDSPDIDRYGLGQLTRVETAFHHNEYFYNQYGELVKHETLANQTAVAPSASQTYVVEYSYNLDGQILQVIYPSGRVIDYSYNAIGLISQVTTIHNGTMQPLASNISYLPFGGINSLTYGNGKVLTQSYNQNYQLTGNMVDGIFNKSYAYNAVNNIETILDNVNTNQTENFAYNSVERLTQATGLYGDVNYSYDAIGNRLNKTESDATTSNSTDYVYQNNSQLTALTGDTNVAMTYDAMGNLLTKGNDSFTYDSATRLLSATVNNQTTHYRYNEHGQRIAKLFENGELRYYVYDQQGLLIAEFNDAAETQVEYVYLNGQPLAMLTTEHDNNVTSQDVILDNTDAVYTGTWRRSRFVSGYYGDHYHYHNNRYSILGAPIDNKQATYVGNWRGSKLTAGYFEDDYQYHLAGNGDNIATWQLGVTDVAMYDVYVTWPEDLNRAPDAKFTINHTNGSDTVIVDQRTKASSWYLLGSYQLDQNSTVSLSDEATSGRVVADAVTILPAGTEPVEVLSTLYQATWTPNVVGEYAVYANWSAHENRATNATYNITDQNGTDSVSVNQQIDGGQWNLLGTYTFDAASIISLNNDADGYVISDGIRLVNLADAPTISKVYYYHNDHLGTPQSLSDSDANLVWQASYQKFGLANITLENVTNNLSFPGQYYDAESGLHYNYFRDYDPELGRYIQSDPIGLAGGINTYGYAYQNPVMNYDPFGLDVWGLNIGFGGTYKLKGSYSYQLMLDSQGNLAIQKTTEYGMGDGTRPTAGVFLTLVYGTPDGVGDLLGPGASFSGSGGGFAAAFNTPWSYIEGGDNCANPSSYWDVPGATFEFGFSRGLPGAEAGATFTNTEHIAGTAILGDIGRWLGSTVYWLVH